MIAELHGKVISENSEDELTGNFFGTLRYVSFNNVLKKIFIDCVKSDKIKKFLEHVNCDNWSKCIKFWCRIGNDEPDIFIEFDEVAIIVEVKFWSGLSGEDQLERYAMALTKKSPDKKKILLLLAPENLGRENFKIQISDVEFDFISWEDILIVLKNFSPPNFYEKIVVEDLTELLKLKGFEGFKNFLIDSSAVDSEKIFEL